MLAAPLGPTLVEAGIILGEAGQHQPRPRLTQATRTLLGVNRCSQSSDLTVLSKKSVYFPLVYVLTKPEFPTGLCGPVPVF